MKLFSLKPYYFMQLTASMLTQVTALILVYILAPEDYGYFALITSLGQMMYILCSGWNNATVINLGTEAYQKKGSYKDIIVYRLIIVAVCFFVISLLFWIGEDWAVKFVGSESNARLVYVFFIGMTLGDFVGNILYPGNKSTIQALLLMLMNGSVLALTCFRVSAVADYIKYNTICQTAGFITLFGLFCYYFGKDSFKYDKKEFRRVLMFSFWQLLGVVGIYFFNIGTNYVLRFYKIEVDDIGLYNFAYKLFSGFVPLFALTGVVVPKWIHNSQIQNLSGYLKSRLWKLYVLAVSAYVLLYFVLPILLHVIHKEDYLDSVGMYLTLLPGFLFYSLNQILFIIIINTPYYKYCQYISITQGAVLVIASFILVGLFGIGGALAANVVNFAVGSILYVLVYKKKVKLYLDTKNSQ